MPLSETPTIQKCQRPLAGKTAIITGASRNLGAGIALGLAMSGANVVIHYNQNQSKKDAQSVAKRAQDLGVKAITLQADLTQTNHIEALFEKTQSVFGTVDIVVNNAGFMPKAPIAETSEDVFDQTFAVNAKSSFFMMKQAARKIEANGRIINIGTSLLAAFTGGYGAYAGSKASLEAFTRALAKETGNRGVTVNTICPGPLDTPFLRDREPQESLDWLASASVQGRLGVVDDIVPWVVFIASPSAGWATGQSFFINGGFATR